MHKPLKCFVIIGYGPKRDHESGRTLDLDKTFENLIKPAFDDLKIECFRAKDIRHTGVIDVPMYEWILNADIVVADLSTLNANALYELGVRHALKPFTTIVISEAQCTYPFDVNHTVIEKYKHLGEDIGVSEATRFKNELKQKIEAVISSQKADSPVYTYLPNLLPPRIKSSKKLELVKPTSTTPSLSDLVEDAEKSKDLKDYRIAGDLYRVCLQFEPTNTFLIQRLALVTYKSEQPNKKDSLLEALKILDPLEPKESFDIETLGLVGAINKRLFEVTRKKAYLEDAIYSYQRGFFTGNDHYNGINLSYLLNIKAECEKDPSIRGHLNQESAIIRGKIVNLCKSLIASKGFSKRDDRHWIYQSLAQAYLGLSMFDEFKKALAYATRESKGEFDIDTFLEQNKKLMELLSIKIPSQTIAKSQKKGKS